MDKLETLLKERYGSNCVKLSDTTYGIKDRIYIEKSLGGSRPYSMPPFSQIGIFNNEELLLSIVDRYNYNDNFVIDTAISFIDMLIEVNAT